MKKSIRFTKIHEPYLYGWTARNGDRQVEVVRVYSGTWHAFLYIGNDIVRGVRKDTTKAMAMQEARAFLEAAL